MSIKLRRGNIIVRLLDKSPLMVAGIELIRTEKNKVWREEQIECEVTHVGPWVDEVKPGDRVVMKGHDGRWIDPGLVGGTDDRSTYRFAEVKDILAVMEPVDMQAQAVA